MNPLVRRIGATFIDTLLSVMAATAFLAVLSYLAGEAFVPGSVWLLAAFFQIIGGAMFTATPSGASPGKMVLGLRVVGDGCALCRETRKVAPVLPFAAALFLNAFGFVASPAWVQWGLAAAGGAYFLYPLITGQPDLDHNRSTGFKVVQTAR